MRKKKERKERKRRKGKDKGDSQSDFYNFSFRLEITSHS